MTLYLVEVVSARLSFAINANVHVVIQKRQCVLHIKMNNTTNNNKIILLSRSFLFRLFPFQSMIVSFKSNHHKLQYVYTLNALNTYHTP